MKTAKLNFLAILGIFSSFGLFAQTSGEWKSVERDEYQLQYPSDWELDESGVMNSEFIIKSPVESSDDQFQENINLLVQDLTGQGFDLEKYTAVSVAQIENMLVEGTILESKSVKKSGKDAQHLVYTGKQGPYSLYFEQYYWVVNEKAYLLTFTAEQKSLDKHKAEAQKVLSSFELTK